MSRCSTVMKTSWIFAGLVVALCLASGPASAAEGHNSASPGDSAHGDSAHGDSAHGDHHVPHFSDVNWSHGFLGEKEGVPPSLLYRPPGTPVPVLALLLNTAILFFILGKYGGPAIAAGLVSRKKRIAGDIEAAAKMHDEAEKQLAHYEEKLKTMATEMDRIKAEMREQAKSERERIIADAEARRVELERDARLIIEQELIHAREQAISIAIGRSIDAAAANILRGINDADHERLATNLVQSLDAQLKKKAEARS